MYIMLVIKIFFVALLATALPNARANSDLECERVSSSENCVSNESSETITGDKEACKSTDHCCWIEGKGCYSRLTLPNAHTGVENEECLKVPFSETCQLPTKESIRDDKDACLNHTDHCCWYEGGCFSRQTTDLSNAQTGDEKEECLKVPSSKTCQLPTNQSIANDREACLNHTEHCCWYEEEGCFSRLKKTVFGLPKVPKPPERLLPIGPGGLFECPEDIEFPLSCVLTGHEPYVTEPPVDIPYCVRIPCESDFQKQARLEKSQLLCGSEPGCYYDVPLGEFRAAFGPSVLAGVPVCQLAIRNEVFLKEARKAAEKLTGGWNPYFTDCTLKTFSEEMEQEQPGCLLIPLLKAFGIYPKMATWKGQTRKGCMYNNGCWIKTEGCFYPVKPEQVFVKSGQRFVNNKFEIVYGRPKCQHFNMANPYTILKSFHICLASGCSIDMNIASTYYENLFEIGKQMDVQSHWEFWNLVEKGRIGSFNLDKGIDWPYDKTFSGRIPAATQPQTFPPPKPPGVPGADMGGGSSGPFNLPSFNKPSPTEPTAGASHGCGPLFRKYNLDVRPCPPPQPDTYQMNKFCPYKPLNIGRYKPLEGSFEGCCEINPCYLSRSDIREMHSGPTHYYTEWSYWQKCTKTCGGGTRTRTRKCISQKPEECTLTTEVVEKCEMEPCPSWSNWGSWEPCPGACKIITRRRICMPKEGECVGDNEETELCNCRSSGK